jgi:hypothetical protein
MDFRGRGGNQVLRPGGERPGAGQRPGAGGAQASDRPVASPAPDNGLRRENLAPSGPQAVSVPRNGPQADGVVMPWAI